MGKIHDASGDWHLPLLACTVLAVVMGLRCREMGLRGRELVARALTVSRTKPTGVIARSWC